MKRYALAIGTIFLAMAACLVAGGTSSEAAGRDVILLHGWNGNTATWAQATAAYQAKGYTVHALALPRAGSKAGDTEANADYVTAYIASHGLANVQLDGHSLGGWLALDLALVRGNRAVTSVVLRDTGTGCYLGIPADQCPDSALLAQLRAARASAVEVLNLSSKAAAHPGVDCLRTYSGLSHVQFMTDAAVNAAAVAWPAVRPCIAVSRDGALGRAGDDETEDAVRRRGELGR